jgi:hypothetical protein
VYAPLAAEIIRLKTARAARDEMPQARSWGERRPAAVRRRLAEALRRSADRLAPEV